MKNQNCGGLARAGILALLFGTPLTLGAAGNPEDIIKYRQNVMKAIGGNGAGAEAILKDKVEFKDRLVEHARAIEAATRNIPALFPPGTDSGADTRAREEIWTKREQFEKNAKDTQEKAAAFAKAAASKDGDQMRSAFEALDKSCSACHREFRKRRQG